MNFLGEYSKFGTAIIMMALIILEQIFSFDLGISERAVTIILAILTPGLIWAVPNRV